MCFRKEQISTFKNLTCMCTVKSVCVCRGRGGTFPKGKITVFVFVSLNPCCYLDNILQVPPGRPSEGEHCGPRGLKGVLSRQHVVPCGWFISVRFSLLHSRFGMNQRASRGFQMKTERPEMWFPYAVRVLRSGEHMFHLVDLLY